MNLSVPDDVRPSDPQSQALLDYLKDAHGPEEGQKIYSDLKLMPHLLKPFLKMHAALEVIFDARKLSNHLKPVLDGMFEVIESVPFRIPVDPVSLGIPDYFDVVKKPMDLSTISTKLDSGTYKNPWQFCEDMWLMFDNAWLYNKKSSKVYKYCTKLSEIFVDLINPVMRNMGYCCGQRLAFTPLTLFCYSQSMCTIARDQPYYVYEATSTQYGVTVPDRYTYCVKCFTALPEAGISLNENKDDAAGMVPKSKFVLMKNDQTDAEPLEKCMECHRTWHSICALYNKKIFPEGFICERCRKENGLPRLENLFTAKKLPHCKLSQFIEDRVNKFLKSSPAGKDCGVIIRVLCNTDKEVEVKPLMKATYGPMGFAKKFPYRTKAVFAFEVIDGTEVCFFGLHVQEYGSNCPLPNQRRVYIAYLDSVHFFQPRVLRTNVYHEILLGYLQYAKQLGYTMAHIWACPLSEGDDQTFHCHPPEQKIPTPKRLQNWFKKLLDKGVGERTVFDYKDIYQEALDTNLITPMSLPYFENDFWPAVIEDCIREAQNEEQERKKREQTSQENDVSNEDDDSFEIGANGKRKKTFSKTSNPKKRNIGSEEKAATDEKNRVMESLYARFEKYREFFFTVRLMSPQLISQIKKIDDPDPLMPSEMMDGRDTFLNRAREERWEFSSLRHAKYSSICFCHALHNQENRKSLSYKCTYCQEAAVRHCSKCEKFNLCNECYETHPHHHRLQILSDDTCNESVQTLVHASQCSDAGCSSEPCLKMKRVITHVINRMCSKRQNSGCLVCKFFIVVSRHHARNCDETNCLVPFCTSFRGRFQELEKSQTLLAEMLVRRRMDMALAQGDGPGSSQDDASTQPETAERIICDHGDCEERRI